MRQKEYIVYKITNLVNNKIYIGRTIYNLDYRWHIHVSHAKNPKTRETYLQRAIYKYTPAKFTIEVIERCSCFDEMVQREIYWIKTFNSIDHNIGYNLIIDSYGNGPREFIAKRTRKKLSLSSHQKQHTNNSGYKGVYYDKNGNFHGNKSWTVRFRYKDLSVLKRFSSSEEAAISYDKCSLYFYGKNAILNFEFKREEYLKDNLQKFAKRMIYKIPKHSKFKDVYFYTKYKKFSVKLRQNSGIYFGTYDTENEAAQVRDKIHYFLYSNPELLNFPEKITDSYKDEGEKIYNLYTNPNKRPIRKKSSASKYMYLSRSFSKWEACISVNGTRYRLGRYASEEEGAVVADLKMIELKGNKAKTNFPIENYINYEI